jgi:hypothetical protein
MPRPHEDLESQLQQIEESYFQFLHMLDDTYSRYELDKPEFIPRPSTTLELPVVQAHPPGFTMLAAVACSEKNIQPDEAVQRVCAAFRQQDDQEFEQGFQKQKQAQVTHHRQQIEVEQLKLLRQLEDPQIKTLCMAGKSLPVCHKPPTPWDETGSILPAPRYRFWNSRLGHVLCNGNSHLVCQDWYFLSSQSI